MPFTATPLALSGVLLVTPRRFEDGRGVFMETYRQTDFTALGIRSRFVQDNQALSRLNGTIRGLHFQRPPQAQAKLVRVLRGAIYDVAVDLRAGSPSYGRSIGVRLQADGRQLFIPRGFAHGYCTLEPDTEITYKCDAYYDQSAEGGIHFADPEIAIDWPVDPERATVSDKDRQLPTLSQIVTPFARELT